MKRRLNHSRPGDSGPNLLPVVNIAMVVLIVFMLGASFAGPEHFLLSKVPFKPTGGGRIEQPEGWTPDERLEVRLDSPTSDAFIARVGNASATTREQLVAMLTAQRTAIEATGTARSDIQVEISPMKTTAYKFLILVQEAALESEFEKVTVTSAR